MDVHFFAIISLLSAISGANIISELIVDYFSNQNIKSVCLLNCASEIWAKNLGKTLMNMSIGFSLLDLAKKTDYSALDKCLRYTSWSLGIVLDVSCEGTDDVLNFASNNRHFAANKKWLIIECKNAIDYPRQEGLYLNKNETIIETISYNNALKNGTALVSDARIMKTLETLNLSIDADIKVALQKGAVDFVLYDVFNYGKIQGGSLIVKEIGMWNSAGVFSSLNKFKYYDRWDFNEMALRMILVISPPPRKFDPKSLKLQDTTPTPGVVTVLKISSIVVHEIAELHNFRFNYTITDRWIGTFEKNSSRVVANSLYFREQDISPIIRYLAYLSDKLEVIHPPITSIETRYYYRIPTKGPGKLENQFLRPLSNGAWLCFIAVSTLCAILLIMSAIVEQRPSMVQYAVFSVIASVCQQFFQDTDDVEGRRISGARKLIILVTGMSCVLVYNFYTSSVVSWLLNGPPPSINSLRELLESPLELIYEDVGYTKSWLQNPMYYYNKRNAKIEDEIRQKKVFNKKKGAPLLKSVKEGIAMVKAGGYAYHTEVNSANDLISKTFTQTELCELGSLQSIEKTNVYACVQKQSPYKKFFDWSLMRLQERGIIDCVTKRMESKHVTCAGSSPRALALGGAAPAFMLLAFGYILATIIMFVERIIFKMKYRNEKI
ncbi:ionotropic receptor 75a-like, partial [Bombyx mandarina]|uniref:Ionotropic receptor 75a-like n=1 Tax=Bombyx mandarina TaxID=7092 RepID=A0A6J2JTL6_BOMMA